MTIESAAFLPGPAPAMPPAAPDANWLSGKLKELPGREAVENAEDGDIQYRISPPSISWPRVFPQL
jgi:hypothetical protein